MWRTAEAAATAATRRAGGIGLALEAERPPQTAEAGDEAVHGVRRRVRRGAAEMGTTVAAARLVAQPAVKWPRR